MNVKSITVPTNLIFCCFLMSGSNVIILFLQWYTSVVLAVIYPFILPLHFNENYMSSFRILMW